MDAPWRELFVHSFKSVVVLSLSRQIIFSVSAQDVPYHGKFLGKVKQDEHEVRQIKIIRRVTTVPQNLWSRGVYLDLKETRMKKILCRFVHMQLMVNDNEQWVCHTTLLQLDCPSGGHWDYAGIFAVEVRFQIKDQVWIPQPELDETKFILDFFCKTCLSSSQSFST